MPGILVMRDYVQAYDGKTITNTNESISVGAIDLYPSGNTQRRLLFMSLLMEKKIHRHNWRAFPVGQDTVERINTISIEQGRPLIGENFCYD